MLSITTVGLVFGAIAPHGGLAVAEACTADELELAQATRAGMEELGRAFSAARPEVVIVVTPHNVHISGAFAVLVAGRVAGSLLNAVGLPELITGNLEDYETLAMKLATTPSLLSGIRAKLVQNRPFCPLFDTDRFRRHIESAYTSMWERYQRGEPPLGFAVQAPG